LEVVDSFPYTKAISVIFGRTLEDLADGTLSKIFSALKWQHEIFA
jgi:hypothetical protein